MRIFQASYSDIPRIMECAKMFTDGIPLVNFNAAHYQSAWENYFRCGIGVIFLAEHEGEIVGGIGGVKGQEDLSGEWYAVEKFWYIKPQFRNSITGVRLLKLFEKWAFSQGCDNVAMIYLECSMAGELEGFYSKSGYKPLERHHVKRIRP